MLRIWGRISSINVRKAVLAAQLLGLEFERIDAGADFGIVDTPEYKAKNPNSLVPLLDEREGEGDGFTLYESNVIVRYLCAKHDPGGMYPLDLRARFDAERWMDWQQTTLNGAGRDAFLQLIRVPESQRQQDLIDRSVAASEPLWDRLDAELSKRAFIAGDRLTMADIPLACEAHRWQGLPLAHKPRPNLQRWYEGLRARPAAAGVLDLPLT
ncbi:glutathione S-transferase family protein [Ramlibacter sp.]|uniref:glutathione S-transferase family protein n=1 Tax=Ramlibacter sp. TaxID=1917967 RepID=UPI003D0ECC16